MRFYVLRSPDGPWGDYGAILLSGMTVLPSQDSTLLKLARTGPFVPPISFPGAVVVTESFKGKLEASGLKGFAFRPVIKQHIVHLEWETWDKEADDPPFYPETGEPEDYLLLQPHSPSLAESMEPLWEILLEPTASVERVQVGLNSWDVNIYLMRASWDGTDFFKAKGAGDSFVSEKAKRWLEQEVPEWVGFDEALTDSQLAECERWIPPLSLDDELRELVRQEKVISAIIRYQQETGCDLADARAYIRSL